MRRSPILEEVEEEEGEWNEHDQHHDEMDRLKTRYRINDDDDEDIILHGLPRKSMMKKRVVIIDGSDSEGENNDAFGENASRRSSQRYQAYDPELTDEAKLALLDTLRIIGERRQKQADSASAALTAKEIPIPQLRKKGAGTSSVASAVPISSLPPSVVRAGDVINISHSSLIKLPSYVLWGENTHQVIRLELQHNRIGLLPDEISRLESLREMNLGHNCLLDLPHGIGMLLELKSLFLQNNLLCRLPAGFMRCVSLRILNISGNRFSEFPAPLLSLKHLSELEISDNPLNSLDPVIFSALKRLRHLRAAQCLLTEIPFQVFHFVKIRSLKIENNMIRELPEEICLLQTLKTLILHDNQLVRLPDCLGLLTSLTKLDVDSNNITTLPNSIGFLSSSTLTDIGLERNWELPLEYRRMSTDQVIQKLYSNLRIDGGGAWQRRSETSSEMNGGNPRKLPLLLVSTKLPPVLSLLPLSPNSDSNTNELRKRFGDSASVASPEDPKLKDFWNEWHDFILTGAKEKHEATKKKLDIFKARPDYGEAQGVGRFYIQVQEYKKEAKVDHKDKWEQSRNIIEKRISRFKGDVV